MFSGLFITLRFNFSRTMGSTPLLGVDRHAGYGNHLALPIFFLSPVLVIYGSVSATEPLALVYLGYRIHACVFASAAG